MEQQQISFDDFKKALFTKDSAYKSYRTMDLQKMYDNKHPLSYRVISASSPPENEPCFLMVDGKEDGPYTAEQIRGMWAVGKLNMNALYRFEGLTDWSLVRLFCEKNKENVKNPVVEQIKETNNRLRWISVGIGLFFLGIMLKSCAANNQ